MAFRRWNALARDVPRYTVAQAGQRCPSGSTIITSTAECQTAAAALNLSANISFTDGYDELGRVHPGGCAVRMRLGALSELVLRVHMVRAAFVWRFYSSSL